jgi:hypothetical protein
MGHVEEEAGGRAGSLLPAHLVEVAESAGDTRLGIEDGEAPLPLVGAQCQKSGPATEEGHDRQGGEAGDGTGLETPLHPAKREEDERRQRDAREGSGDEPRRLHVGDMPRELNGVLGPEADAGKVGEAPCGEEGGPAREHEEGDDEAREPHGGGEQGPAEVVAAREEQTEHGQREGGCDREPDEDGESPELDEHEARADGPGETPVVDDALRRGRRDGEVDQREGEPQERALPEKPGGAVEAAPWPRTGCGRRAHLPRARKEGASPRNRPPARSDRPGRPTPGSIGGRRRASRRESSPGRNAERWCRQKSSKLFLSAPSSSSSCRADSRSKLR